MQINFSNFSVAARNVISIAHSIKILRGRRDIDDIDLTIAASTVKSPASDSLKELGIGFSELASALNIKHITQRIPTPINKELQVPELDDYKDFTPCGRFVVHWAPNLALNTACRNIRKPDGFPLGDPTDLIVGPQHILFVALSNRTAPPSKLIENAYQGVDLDPARTLRENLGFKSCDVTNSK